MDKKAMLSIALFVSLWVNPLFIMLGFNLSGIEGLTFTYWQAWWLFVAIGSLITGPLLVFQSTKFWSSP